MPRNFRFSLEFFPPRSAAKAIELRDVAQALLPFGPEFMSVTYGASGSTIAETPLTLAQLSKETDVPLAGHLACAAASKEASDQMMEDYLALGVRQIVALFGDAPQREAADAAPGYESSLALVAAAREAGFERIYVGFYPEAHPKSRGFTADIDYLKAKMDAGATAALSQFFFTADHFLRFRDAAVAAGVSIPLIPGILPVRDWGKVSGFARQCGVETPDHLLRGFEAARERGSARLYALAHATQLCDQLLSAGVADFHFYTLNQSDLTMDVLSALKGSARGPRLEPLAVAS